MPDTLNPKQRQALELATNWFHHPNKPIFKLAGYAGTGKTFTARYIADSLTNSVAYCAYTGKAANVMQRHGMPARSEVSCHLDSVTDFSVDDVWLVDE